MITHRYTTQRTVSHVLIVSLPALRTHSMGLIMVRAVGYLSSPSLELYAYRVTG